MNTELKKERLLSELRRLGRVAVAFSAGVDSTFLLSAAQETLGKNVLAVTGRSVCFPAWESAEAIAFCNSRGIEQVVVDVDPLSIAGFVQNPPDRCYICKKAIFTQFIEIARQKGFDCLVEGTNADDVGDYRPGMRAVAELGVGSPLKDAGLTKQEIRMLSETMGLPTWDKPSYACLATRFPYGERITEKKLRLVEQAEQFLQEKGFRQVRVRVHGDVARIEIDRSAFPKLTNPKMLESVCQAFHVLGFPYVTLDLDGYKTGSMNKTIRTA